jgi:excisionase family DNA binding protein
MEKQSNYMKIDEAARYLGVSRRTVYRWVWDGKLPASKVGGLYFIDPQDLEDLLKKREAQPASEEKVEAFEQIKCGYCFRLIKNATGISDLCQAGGCDQVICKRCQQQGIHYCAQHTPDREQQLALALEKQKKGEIAFVLKASNARMLEINYLNRIQHRLSEQTSIIHPLSGEVINIKDWKTQMQEADQRKLVMSYLGKVVLDGNTQASLPLNAYLQYRIAGSSKSDQATLDILIQCITHLPAMLQVGFDSEPCSAEDLSTLIQKQIEKVAKRDSFCICVFAATSGWNSEARALIQGVQSDRLASNNQALMHVKMLFYLFDMQSGELIYNQQDLKARRYAQLFQPGTSDEEIQEAVRAIKNELLGYESLSLSLAKETLPFQEHILEQAFRELANSSGYTIMDITGIGVTIVRQAGS